MRFLIEREKCNYENDGLGCLRNRKANETCGDHAS